MNQLPPLDPGPPKASAEISETQAAGRGLAAFVALYVSVLGILWAVKAYFG
jgi:hypothetical protein